MNRSLANVLQYYWMWFVAVLLVAVFGWYFAFNLLHSPKDFESISLFYGGVAEDYSIETDYQQRLEQNGVYKVTLSTSNPLDKTFNTKYSYVGLYNSDLLILPKDVLDNTKCEDCFLNLSTLPLDAYLSGSYEYYYQENLCYGIVLDENVKTRLSQYFIFTDTDYVIVISALSVNAGQEGITNNAYHILKLILEE